jgi:ribosomal protein S18 acetylase RimI-like enzyme
VSFPDVEAIERAGAKAWPGVEEKWDGAWLRRAAGGYTKRANCVQCFDPDDFDDADLRVISASSWMVIRSLKPVFRITPLSSPELNATLEESGWQEIDPSHVMAMEIGDVQADAECTILPALDQGFLQKSQKLLGYSDADVAGLKNLVAATKVPVAGVLLSRDGVPVASSIVAVADGMAVTGNVVTDPSRRRQGLGAAMMRSGLAWAKSQGAKYATLNVMADNAAAIGLYQGLGYTVQYDYSYRVPGTK